MTRLRKKFPLRATAELRVAGAPRTFLALSKPELNIVVFANGARFEKTAREISRSLGNFEHLSISFELQTLGTISESNWFSKIADFPDRPPRPGRRDGYHCAYKPWVILEALKNSSRGSVTYYLDASQYYQVGFYRNIEPLVSRFWRDGESQFLGSAMPHFLEAHQNWGESEKHTFLNRMGLGLGLDFFGLPALLASSMMHIHNDADIELVRRWAEACDYETVSLNHTGEQSVLMAFLAAENRKVLNLSFDDRVKGRGFEVSHGLGKNHNLVHELFSRHGDSIFAPLSSLQPQGESLR
jgi:hypothetical protein